MSANPLEGSFPSSIPPPGYPLSLFCLSPSRQPLGLSFSLLPPLSLYLVLNLRGRAIPPPAAWLIDC